MSLIRLRYPSVVLVVKATLVTALDLSKRHENVQ